MSGSALDWIYNRGETNPPGDNRFESSEGLRVGVEAGYDRRSGVSVRAPGGHSCVTHSRNQADTGGHRRTRRKSNSSTGGTARTPQDTRGHAIAPVRDREAPGSNPGPPTNLYARVERNALTLVVCGSASSCLYRDDSTAISAILPATLL